MGFGNNLPILFLFGTERPTIFRMSDLTTYIDLYCERTAIGFINEPLNALSNLSFIVAGWWNWQKIRAESGKRFAAVLSALVALIGVGSFAFHTLPSRLTQWLDVGPIWFFSLACGVAVVHILAGRRWRKTVVITGLALIVLIGLFVFTGEVITATPPVDAVRPFNGSMQYLPVILALLLACVSATLTRHQAAFYLWSATGLFTAALVFRTLDLGLCPALPFGTHFIWHVLTGVTAGVLVRLVARSDIQ